MRSAPGFQKRMMPSWSAATIASAVVDRIAWARFSTTLMATSYHQLTLNRLRLHHDGAARAFLGAHAAALAVIVVELEAVALAELDHRVVRAHAVAVVALEAVAAGEAAARLVKGGGLLKTLHHFLEGRLAAHNLERRPHGFRRVRVVPLVELVEGGNLVLLRRRIGDAAQPGVDVARRLFAVTDTDRDGALGRHHVAAREYAGMAGHHVGPDLDHTVLHRQPGHALKQREVDVLAERQDHRVGRERLEFAGRLRKALGVELHLLDRDLALVHPFDGGEPLHHDAFFDGLLDLKIVRRHLFASPAINNNRLGRAEALGGAGDVERGVAAAIDHDAAAKQ